jgi:hypothetical protein
VGAATDDFDCEVVAGRGQRARLGDDPADLEPAVDVGAEDRRGIVQGAGLQDGGRALARLLGGLEEDDHVADGGARLE